MSSDTVMSGAVWSPDEDAHLLAERNRGVSHEEIAVDLRRGVDAVRHRWLALARGAGNVGVGPVVWLPWSDREEAVLRTMIAAGSAWSDIAVSLGRTISGVQDKARRLRLRRTAATPLPWSDAETEQLRQLHAAGRPMDEMMAALGRPRSSVAHKIWRLGLGPVLTVAVARRPSSSYTVEDDETIARLYATHTAAAIGRMLGRSRCAVIARAGRLGLAKRKSAPPKPRVQAPQPVARPLLSADRRDRYGVIADVRELRERGCRWMHTDGSWCERDRLGDQAMSRTTRYYCSEHASVVTR